MKPRLSLLGLTIFCLVSASALAQSTRPTAEAFVPPDYFVLKKAEGDLNKDGLPDVALISAPLPEKGIDNRPNLTDVPRVFQLFFKQATGYTQVGYSDKLILCRMCGGMLGDPLQELKIERGTVFVSFYGGSRDRWGYDYRFRWQNGDWFLIGETIVSQDNMNLTGEKSDTNLVTGLTVVTSTNQDQVSEKRVQGKPAPLKTLSQVMTPN